MHDAARVELVDVTPGNWRDIAAVAPRDDQRAFVAPSAAFYMLLGEREGVWRSLGLAERGRIVGHAMWAVDPSDGSRWIGGVIVDAPEQGRGLGRAAMAALIDHLRALPGPAAIRLSVHPANARAWALYTALGFAPTGELEGEERVLELVGAPG
jgi:diamine N-acetyltransferase